MKQKPAERPASSERIIRDIKRKTRKQYSAEEKIRIVLDGLRGEDSIAELCRREGIAQSLYYKWSKEFIECTSSAHLAPLALESKRYFLLMSGLADSTSKFFVSGVIGSI
jgi:transposase